MRAALRASLVVGGAAAAFAGALAMPEAGALSWPCFAVMTGGFAAVGVGLIAQTAGRRR